MKNVFKRENFAISLIIGLIITIGVVLIEQILKIITFTLAQDTNKYLIFGEFLKLVNEKNYGFMGLDVNYIILSVILAAAFVMFLLFGLFADFTKAPLFSTGVFLICGSCLAFLVDRIAVGYSLNYLSIASIPAFSFSHIAVIFGALLLVLDLVFAVKKNEKDAAIELGE